MSPAFSPGEARGVVAPVACEQAIDVHDGVRPAQEVGYHLLKSTGCGYEAMQLDVTVWMDGARCASRTLPSRARLHGAAKHLWW